MENVVIGIIILVILIYIIGTRNHFAELHSDVETQMSNISNYVENRTKSLTDALQIAKLSYSHEVEGIEKLTGNEQYNQLSYLGQKYPQLMSTQSYQQALSQVQSLNAEIAASKTLLNGNINVYNKAIKVFPACIIAMIFGYKRESFIDEENMLNNKKVDTREVDFSKF